MQQISVYDATYEKLAFAARISGRSIAEVLRQLTSSSGPTAGADGVAKAPETAGEHEIGVYVLYRGTRVAGALDLSTERMRITEGPSVLAGREFRSPTQAAVETVKVLNPDRERPETNGWRFWKDASTHRIIDTLRGSTGG